jgi:hypothetical protein
LHIIGDYAKGRVTKIAVGHAVVLNVKNVEGFCPERKGDLLPKGEILKE